MSNKLPVSGITQSSLFVIPTACFDEQTVDENTINGRIEVVKQLQGILKRKKAFKVDNNSQH